MTDIIFISFEFPPLNIGGVFRPLNFAKFLPENGIRPHVYTLLPDDYSKIFPKPNLDANMLDDIEGRDIALRQIPIDPLSKLDSNRIKRFTRIYFSLYRGSDYKLWRKHLLKQVKEDAKNVAFKAVLVTAPPFGMIALGYEIAKLLNIPLLVDMRDAWALWNTSPYGSYFHYLATLQKERKYFGFARKIIATSDQTIADWQKLHPHLPIDKFTCITNGFDGDRIQPAFKAFELHPITPEKPFTIVYVGSFYYSPDARNQMLEPFYKKKGHRMIQYYPRKQDWLYRSPYFFFQTLKRVFNLHPEWKALIRIEFAGNPQPWMEEMIETAELRGVVKQIGFVSHEQSLNLQRSADALLITSAKVEGGRDCFIAGKTFEYMTMNKPILAFVSNGSQKDILAKSGLAVLFNPDDIEDSARKFIDMLANGKRFSPDDVYLNQFDRKTLTKALASVINECVDNS